MIESLLHMGSAIPLSSPDGKSPVSPASSSANAAAAAAAASLFASRLPTGPFGIPNLAAAAALQGAAAAKDNPYLQFAAAAAPPPPPPPTATAELYQQLAQRYRLFLGSLCANNTLRASLNNAATLVQQPTAPPSIASIPNNGLVEAANSFVARGLPPFQVAANGNSGGIVPGSNGRTGSPLRHKILTSSASSSSSAMADALGPYRGLFLDVERNSSGGPPEKRAKLSSSSDDSRGSDGVTGSANHTADCLELLSEGFIVCPLCENRLQLHQIQAHLKEELYEFQKFTRTDLTDLKRQSAEEISVRSSSTDGLSQSIENEKNSSAQCYRYDAARTRHETLERIRNNRLMRIARNSQLFEVKRGQNESGERSSSSSSNNGVATNSASCQVDVTSTDLFGPSPRWDCAKCGNALLADNRRSSMRLAIECQHVLCEDCCPLTEQLRTCPVCAKDVVVAKLLRVVEE